MALIKRAALVVSLLSVGLLSFFAASVAVDAHARPGAAVLAGGGGGGGGGFLPAGNYRNSSVNVSECCSGLTVSVIDLTNAADPLVGPSSFTSEIDVSFNICDFVNGVCGSGCFVAGPNDFTFGSDLSSATLNTTFTGAQPACAQPFGGPPVFFQPPLPPQPTFTLMATWKNIGPVASSTNIGRYACSGYTTETSTSGSSANGVTATTQISLEPGATFGPIGGFFGSFDQTVHAQGTPAATCNPVGGKGAGPGPQNPGNYQFAFQQSFVTVFTSGAFPVPLNVSVNSRTNVASPRGGPTTTQSETDLNISEPFFPPTISGCFVLLPGAFTITSAGASLHVAIDIDNPNQAQCQFTPPPMGLPDEFNVDITWSANGALANFRSDSTFSCGGLLVSVSSSVQTSVNASANGQLSGITDPFNGVSTNLFTDASTIHAVRPATC